MDFKTTLEWWKDTERAFASKLIQKCKDIEEIKFAPNQQFKDWDIKVIWNWKEKTYEIKRDYKSQETNNLALEVRCNNKPSGLYASKADYIVYCLNEWEFYFQNRWELLYRLDYMWKKLVRWWDGDRSEMYLISKEELPLLFNKI
jgi:hypothetical protein